MSSLFRNNKLALAGFVIACILVAVQCWRLVDAVRSGRSGTSIRLQGPSWRHPFGNDELGRDILSRLLLGARVSMRVGGTVVLLSGVVGVLIGGLAGYNGGKLDTFVTVIVIDSLMAFPGILLAIALVAFLGPGLDRLIFALVIIGWVGMRAWREARS
jgi:peptide/nickel transport system permease protein